MLYYFSEVSFMYTYENMIAKIFAIIILTCVLPVLFLLLLKPIKVIDNLHLDKVQQRRIPLLFFLTITAVITNFIFDPIEYRIPFYFFSAVFFSGVICFLLTFIKHKISLHALGISTFSVFVIVFNKEYGLDGVGFTSLCILVTGWVIASRLYMGAHTIYELITGLLLGIISQLLFLQYWNIA
jgi:membrane-associated phospholipid phosphatase